MWKDLGLLSVFFFQRVQSMFVLFPVDGQNTMVTGVCDLGKLFISCNEEAENEK
jgi:hypothetical protein